MSTALLTASPSDGQSQGCDLDPARVTLEDLPGLIARHEQRGAALALAAARLEAEGEWAADGTLSMTAWLRERCRMSNESARSLLRDGHFLRRFPAVAEAALDGRLAEAHLRALRLVARRAIEPILDEMQESLVDTIAPLSPADAATVCAAWKARAEALVPGTEPKVRERELHFSTSDDGCLVGRFVLDADLGRQFQHALSTASAAPSTEVTRARRHADALGDVCGFFNANHGSAGTPRHRPHVEVTIDLDDLVDTHDGVDDPREQARTAAGLRLTGSLSCDDEALLCDCVLHRVARSGSAVLDYGRSTRTVPHHLFRAVAQRDGGCRYPGCDRPVSWCEAHHLRYWRHGGATELGNLVLLCARHHRVVHRPGWTAALAPDGTFVLRTLDGIERRSTPPPRVTLHDRPRAPQRA